MHFTHHKKALRSLRCEIHRREVSNMLQQSKRPYDAHRAEAWPKRIRGLVSKSGRVQAAQQTQRPQQPSSSTYDAGTSAQRTADQVVDTKDKFNTYMLWRIGWRESCIAELEKT